jgi:serine/threonine-protein kinase
MVGSTSRRTRIWHASSNDEESRTYLQERLETLSKVLFWCFAAFLVFLFGLYALFPGMEPAWSSVTFISNTVGLVLLVAVWRGLLARRAFPLRALYAIDAVYAGGVGVFLAFNAAFGTDLQFAPFTCLLFACLVVLTRAIIVPSTGNWTLVMASATFVPMVAVAIETAISGRFERHFPAFALVGGVTAICAVVTLLAGVGSRTSYGLRQTARAAIQLGSYQLGRKIAEGGMGAVYIAHHVMLRRPTAIKLVLPERVGNDTLERFAREVQLTSKLTHPNTVAVFDYGRSPDGVFYYAMEYLDGINLQDLVLRYGVQPQQRVLAILAQVASALHEAHGKGLVHRDVKPGNIMLCERGALPDIAKVLDFGLVKELAQDMEQTRQIVGTAGYIAPETITDSSVVTPAADIYSLGAVAYFLLSGKRVFEGQNPLDVCVKHVTQPSPRLEKVAAPIADLVERCLAKSPETRPTALELVCALRAIDVEDWSEAQAQAWWSEFRTQSSFRKSRGVRTARGGRRAAGGGRWAASGGRRAVGGERWAACFGQQIADTSARTLPSPAQPPTATAAGYFDTRSGASGACVCRRSRCRCRCRCRGGVRVRIRGGGRGGVRVRVRVRGCGRGRICFRRRAFGLEPCARFVSAPLLDGLQIPEPREVRPVQRVLSLGEEQLLEHETGVRVRGRERAVDRGCAFAP